MPSTGVTPTVVLPDSVVLPKGASIGRYRQVHLAPLPPHHDAIVPDPPTTTTASGDPPLMVPSAVAPAGRAPDHSSPDHITTVVTNATAIACCNLATSPPVLVPGRAR